ncbi:phage head-tail connector protein [Enterococcus sp. AZ109]|uniref:phage head-tail connector protein n=1 Tax=Enterococcus sp. AZ109 TaxID=2774634 RepID=UPI003F26511F
MNETNKKCVEDLQSELARKFSITGDDKLAVLADDIKDALMDALDYCNRETVIGHMSSAIKDLYIFRRNTEGNEGETSKTEGGVSQSFEVGIPKKIQTKLNRYRVAKIKKL